MKPFLTTPEEAVENLRKNAYTVGVFGFGHVGSVIGVGWGLAGARVIGMTLDQQALRLLKTGASPFPEEAYLTRHMQILMNRGLLEITDSYSYGARESDIKIIAVPVYLSSDKKPDLTPIIRVTEEIGRSLVKGDIVIVETSVPPGTTRNVVKPILEKSGGLKADEDFALAYSPERISAGTALADYLEKYPKIVGCDSKRSLTLVAKLYSEVVKKGVITMSSTVAAETEKLFEGIYRDVNIALANELALLCEKIGISYDEIRAAANSQPFSHLHNPGIGVGGACIPVYPYFVIEIALKQGVQLQITQLARNINEAATELFVEKIIRAIRMLNIELSGCSFALFGLSFRGGTSDTRFSPALRILNFIQDTGADFKVYDPLVEELEDKKVKIFRDWRQVVRGANVIIIASDHKEFYGISVEEMSRLTGRDFIIVDGKNVISNLDAKPEHRVLYVGVGRPALLIEPGGRKKHVEV